MKRRLRHVVVTLALLVLGIAAALTTLLAWGVLSESGSQRLFQLALTAAERAGVQLQVQRVRGTLAGGLQLQELRYAAADGSSELQVQQLAFAWQPWHLWQRQVRLDGLDVTALRWTSRSDATEPTAFDARDITRWFAALPVSVAVQRTQARDLRFVIDDAVVDIAELRFAAELDPTRLALHDLQVAAFDARVDAELELRQDLALQGELQWSRGEADAYAGMLQLGGSLSQLQLQHVLTQPLVVRSNGTLATGLVPDQSLQFELTHSLDTLDMARYSVDGLLLSNLQLQTRGTPARIELGADLQAEYPQFAPLAVSAGAVYTPQLLTLDAASLSSPELQLALQGRWDLAARTLDIAWALQELALARDGFALTDTNGSGTVTIALTDAGVDAELAIGPLQGRLNEQALTLDGHLMLRESQPETLTLQLQSGQNALRVNGALQPALALEWALQAPALVQLHEGLSGRLEGAGALTGAREAPLLQGSLQGEGLGWRLAQGQLLLQSLQIDARAAVAADSVDTNALTLQLSGLRLESSDDARTLLDSATATLSGTTAAHQLQVRATQPQASLELALRGGIEAGGWQGRMSRAVIESSYGNWTLQAPLTLALQERQLRLDEHCWSSAPLLACLAAAGNADDGIDLQLDVSAIPLAWLNRAAQAAGKPPGLQDLQTALGLDLPPGVSLQGSAALQARIDALRATGPAAVQAQLETEGLQVELQSQVDPLADEPPAEPQRFSVEAAPLQLSLQQQVWRAGTRLTITQAPQEGNAAELQGSLDGDITFDADHRLGGVVQLSFADLAFLETLLPGLQQPRGRLQGTARLAGTLQQPQLDADVVVSDAAFHVPTLGIDLRNVGATLSSSSEVMNLRASAASGDGELTLQASLLRPLSADREFSARLEGSDFRLLETDAAAATISPAVELRYAQDRLSLQGQVELPTARLDLESVVAQVADDAVSLSRDAVVVQPDATALVAEQQRVLPFDAQFLLKLGEAVQVDGFGLDARLNGELRLEQEAGRPLLAYGELGIPEGSYRIYNQELNARDGRLLFYGNPVNPVLDVRAFRATATAEVGMLLSGTFDRMQSRLYSTPTLPENEILALLVTGKSFNNMNDQDGNALLSAVANFGIERGEGLTSMIGDKLGLDSVSINGGDSYLDSSLGLGKYITPDLLMRYEIGLFDRQAVLSIDYSLTERLKLEVRSGLSQSVDVSYTIEKD